jgi:hypothetical protein
MQESLNSFYETLRSRTVDPADDLYDRLRGPDLIWVSPAYVKATPRIVLIGQQQDGWSYSYREFMINWTIERAVAEYRDFNFGERYNASPFWQFYNRLRRGVYGDESERGVIAWVNLVKFVTVERDSVIGTRFEDRALTLQDGIFAKEINILRPDVCIFATGPSYNRIIQRYFPGALFEDSGLGTRVLAIVKHELLPKRSFRTYHPKALRLKKHWEAVLEQLRDFIKPKAL